jgi:carbon storage regulator
MLVLSRRVSESLMIGGDITVTILGIKGNQIRIGITAPKNTEVDREEIYLKKQKNLAAENTSTKDTKPKPIKRFITQQTAY